MIINLKFHSVFLFALGGVCAWFCFSEFGYLPKQFLVDHLSSIENVEERVELYGEINSFVEDAYFVRIRDYLILFPSSGEDASILLLNNKQGYSVGFSDVDTNGIVETSLMYGGQGKFVSLSFSDSANSSYNDMVVIGDKKDEVTYTDLGVNGSYEIKSIGNKNFINSYEFSSRNSVWNKLDVTENGSFVTINNDKYLVRFEKDKVVLQESIPND